MKLTFPNGEHGQVLLSDGVSRIGSAPDSQVRLSQSGVAPVHCELQLAGGILSVRVPDPSNPVTINGKVVQGVMALRGGDQIGIAGVIARVASVERAAGKATADNPDLDADSGATRMRMAVPKYVLRGVSGPAFGKTFPIPGLQTIGRSDECNIAIATDEISRRHASVKPTPDGLAVEDLGSANGTFINGQRVQNGLLKPGDELRLDTVRFLLVAPGMEISSSQRPTVQMPQPNQEKSKTGLWIGVGVGVLAVLAGGWYFLF